MLSLITGVPGSGKTLWLVNQLMTNKHLKDRPLYVCGIPELKIPHEPITAEQVHDWPNWAPTGAIIVVDECQKVFRPRRSGADVPAYVAELETHRHRGLDFYLLTQNPRLIDSNVRDLVGEHRHIGKTLLGFRRMLYWNSGGAKNPAARRDIAEAVASPYVLPKAAMGMYKSAEEHTKLGGKVSRMVYILPVVIIITVALFIHLKGRYGELTQEPGQAPAAVAAGQPPKADERAALAISEEAAGGGRYPTQAEEKPIPKLSADNYKPVQDGKPWTAPIYAPLNEQIVTMPFPVACVKNAQRCTCYTDQGTPIRGMDKGLCLDFVQNGIYNPHKAAVSAGGGVAKASTPAVPQAETPQVLALDGKNKYGDVPKFGDAPSAQ